jgi:hypothetical protein
MTEGITRRQLFKAFLRASAASAVVGAGGVFYVTEVEPGWHTVERVRIPLPNLPPAFEGYRLVQLSDIHVMGKESVRIVEEAIRTALGLQPDMIVITGDYVTGGVNGDALRAVLRPLHAPDGVWAVMGNHDHWSGVAAVRAAVSDVGIGELRNTHTRIQREGASLWLAGVDDIWENKHDLDAALAGIPEGAATILLAHEPDYADSVYPTGRVGLQLSGHSHGGQVRLPFIGAPILPYLGEKYPIGKRKLGDMWLYTNRGVGSIAPIVRFNCRPEVTLITLTRA